MKQVVIVILKEIMDNIRDRRSFFFALIYGPILMPFLIFAPMIFGLKATMIDYDATSNLHVVGAEHAPNLIQYLRNQNLEAVPAPENFREQIKEREIDVVLEITAEYADKLREGRRAPLTLYVNDSSKKSKSAAAQVQNIINSYSLQLGYLRMTARGLNPEIQNAINLLELDLSTEGVSGIIFGFFVYFVLVFSMMTGGFYLAVDTTAGERERNSLEPLLSLPISRSSLLLGKWFAVLAFVCLSSTLSALFMYLTLTLLPTGDLSEIFQINGLSLFISFLIMLPCALFVSSVLVTISAFTRSSKEAQTYISVMYLIPMAPTILSQFLDIKPHLALSLVPFFSQNQLIGKVVKNEILPLDHVIVASIGTLIFAVILLLLAMWLYRQDKILAQ